jgi:hypothetical protein
VVAVAATAVAVAVAVAVAAALEAHPMLWDRSGRDMMS